MADIEKHVMKDAKNEKACRGRRCGRLFEKPNSSWEEECCCSNRRPWEEEWVV
jgi:hypothetical protein